MDKQINEFYIQTKDNVITQVGHAVMAHPVICFNNKGIPWFDDSKLIRTKKAEERKMRIEELVEVINMLRWVDGITIWEITEEFKQTKEYTLEKLKIEVEQGTVCAADAYEEIYSSSKVLMGFLVDSIKDIEQKDKTEFVIHFADGTITLKGVIWQGCNNLLIQN